MAYNRENKLRQIIDVQNTFKKHKMEGVTTAYVFRTYIKPKFHISLQTLYIYLATRAEHELKKILAEKAEQQKNASYKQTNLFNPDDDGD